MVIPKIHLSVDTGRGRIISLEVTDVRVKDSRMLKPRWMRR